MISDAVRRGGVPFGKPEGETTEGGCEPIRDQGAHDGTGYESKGQKTKRTK